MLPHIHQDGLDLLAHLLAVVSSIMTLMTQHPPTMIFLYLLLLAVSAGSVLARVKKYAWNGREYDRVMMLPRH
ncbi:TPA: hypothetical protein MIM64_23295 [Klebsiella variicola]|nr:hypothetical protein [Klebsiella variicola]